MFTAKRKEFRLVNQVFGGSEGTQLTFGEPAHFPEQLARRDLATRILARSRETAAESWEDIVSALGLRAILATTAIGLLAAGLAFSDWYEFRIERPAVERTFTNDLSWP